MFKSIIILRINWIVIKNKTNEISNLIKLERN